MPGKNAHLVRIEALQKLQAALRKFAADLDPIINESGLRVQRATKEVDERGKHWATEERKAKQAVDRARRDLEASMHSRSRRSSVSDVGLHQALQRAERRQAQCARALTMARRSKASLVKAQSEHRSVAGEARNLVNRSKKGGSNLKRMYGSLQSYIRRGTSTVSSAAMSIEKASSAAALAVAVAQGSDAPINPNKPRASDSEQEPEKRLFKCSAGLGNPEIERKAEKLARHDIYRRFATRHLGSGLKYSGNQGIDMWATGSNSGKETPMFIEVKGSQQADLELPTKKEIVDEKLNVSTDGLQQGTPEWNEDRFDKAVRKNKRRAKTMRDEQNTPDASHARHLVFVANVISNKSALYEVSRNHRGRLSPSSLTRLHRT